MIQQSITSEVKFVSIISIVLSIILTSTVCADDHHSKTKVEKHFPANVVIEYNNEQLELSLTGLTIRKKFFLKIYSMAHYIEQKPGVTDSEISDEKIYKNILQQNVSKQISMVFMRALKAKQIQESLVSGIKLNTNEEEYIQILPQLEQFIRPISEDVKKNDEFILRWFPDSTIISIFQGQQISTIKDETFARALWSIWFGEHAVVDRSFLINQLLSSS